MIVLRRVLAVVFGVAFVGGALAACNDRPERDEAGAERDLAVPVAVEPVGIGSIRTVVHATGIVSPAPGAELLVMAPEAALITEIPVKEGDPVASGDLLVRFDIASANATAARQHAEVARAQGLLESARVSHARTRDLLERGIISRREMEDADRALADAQAAAAASEAARASADAAVARSIVRAPFGGVVARRLHNPGDFVQAAATDPILRIVDTARLEVIATIRAAETSRVLPGAAAHVAAATGAAPIRLTVVSRPSTSGLANGTIRLAFLEPTMLPVDVPVEVDIDAGERVDVVLIPVDALVRDGAETAVFVASGDRAARRLVTTGAGDAERIEITSGLRRGELLITRGHAGLPDGARISVAAAAR